MQASHSLLGPISNENFCSVTHIVTKCKMGSERRLFSSTLNFFDMNVTKQLSLQTCPSPFFRPIHYPGAPGFNPLFP